MSVKITAKAAKAEEIAIANRLLDVLRSCRERIVALTHQMEAHAKTDRVILVIACTFHVAILIATFLAHP